ncbi:MAG: GHMP kinase [Gammaproteobacteria bacterium]|nr:GHMP kinase [Gammaproteobacteria bacterium]
MIISRTPFRISFVGGGTDLRSFYSEEPGQVLSTSIDKYIYVVVKRQIGIVEHKYRINWSKVEFCNHIEDIEHPIVREALKLFEIDFPIEITTFSDIPGSTGLGSSSAFAVGLVHALYALKGKHATKHTLASEAGSIEVDILKRTMGKQDHFASAYGDLNVFTFNPDETIAAEPVFYTNEVKNTLEQNMMLFYTELKRDASEVLESQNQATENKRDVLVQMRDLVHPLRDVLSGNQDMRTFGEILHNGWLLKKSITNDISNSQIDNYYDKARQAGAIGGKLLGAGGGGFLLLYVEPDKQTKVIEALSELFCLDVKLDGAGTRITYYDQDRIDMKSSSIVLSQK